MVWMAKQRMAALAVHMLAAKHWAEGILSAHPVPSAAGPVDDMATKGGDLFGCRMSAGPAGSPSARHPCERVERRGVLAGWTQRGGNRAPYQRQLLPTVYTFISPGRQTCRTVDFSLRGRGRCRPVPPTLPTLHTHTHATPLSHHPHRIVVVFTAAVLVRLC